ASVSAVLQGDRASTGLGVGRRTLVVAEVALALVLLVGSGLLVRSLARLLSVDTGFDKSNLITFTFEPPPSMPADALPGLYSQILNRVRAVPGVADAALDSCVPLVPSCIRTSLVRADEPVPENLYAKVTGLDVVTPNWFSLMHVPLLRGRPFSSTD